ncbi:MAG: ATP-binding protein [Deltaproteobacteria bacterium]
MTATEDRPLENLVLFGRMASGIAHDLSNLMTVILMLSDCARADADHPDRVAAHLDELDATAQRGADLTRKLMDFLQSRTTEKRLIAPNDVIRGIERLLNLLVGPDVTLRLDLDAEVGRVVVDPGAFEQLVMNLAVNARDAMPDGGALVITTRTTTSPSPEVVVSVVDEGVGMSEETKKKIFETCFTTKGNGTGLGLAMCQQIVCEARGRIEVASELGVGTRFDVHLPREDETTSA